MFLLSYITCKHKGGAYLDFVVLVGPTSWGVLLDALISSASRESYSLDMMSKPHLTIFGMSAEVGYSQEIPQRLAST